MGAKLAQTEGNNHMTGLVKSDLYVRVEVAIGILHDHRDAMTDVTCHT